MPTPLSITPDLASKKAELLDYFRSRAAERLVDIEAQFGMAQQNKRAAAVNPAINEERERLLAQVMQVALRESWKTDSTLPVVLLIHYAASVVMLETRNNIRPYETSIVFCSLRAYTATSNRRTIHAFSSFARKRIATMAILGR